MRGVGSLFCEQREGSTNSDGSTLERRGEILTSRTSECLLPASLDSAAKSAARRAVDAMLTESSRVGQVTPKKSLALPRSSQPRQAWVDVSLFRLVRSSDGRV
jgi:hypothetical protein